MAKKPNGKPPAEASADEIIAAAKFDPDNIIGQCADEMLADMKAARNLEPWEKLDEEKQRALIEAARYRAKALVAGVVDAAATRGFPHYVAKVGAYSGKMGASTVYLKVQVPAENFDPERLHGSAVLVFASAAEYGMEMQARPEPDDPPLLDEEFDPDTGELSSPEMEAGRAR